MSPTVDSLLPLSFLEAVRNVDTPDDDPDTELVAELRNKRLGLSDTVYAQIRRYSDAVKRSQRTVRDEAVALARLIGRRPDAEAVFRAAGRFLATEAYQGISPMTRQVMLTLPSLIARPIAQRHARRIVTRYFGHELETDLNDDGREDVVFLVTQGRGGSGTGGGRATCRRRSSGLMW